MSTLYIKFKPNVKLPLLTTILVVNFCFYELKKWPIDKKNNRSKKYMIAQLKKKNKNKIFKIIPSQFYYQYKNKRECFQHLNRVTIAGAGRVWPRYAIII